MTEFSNLSDEELALLETMYHSDTWKAFCHVVANCQGMLKEQAVLFLTTGSEKDALICAQRHEAVGVLVQVFDNKFTEEKEVEMPESKPRAIHELMP